MRKVAPANKQFTEDKLRSVILTSTILFTQERYFIRQQRNCGRTYLSMPWLRYFFVDWISI